MGTQHTKHTKRSHSRTRSRVSHEQETRDLKHEIDHLRKKFHRGNVTGEIPHHHQVRNLENTGIDPIAPDLGLLILNLFLSLLVWINLRGTRTSEEKAHLIGVEGMMQ